VKQCETRRVLPSRGVRDKEALDGGAVKLAKSEHRKACLRRKGAGIRALDEGEKLALPWPGVRPAGAARRRTSDRVTVRVDRERAADELEQQRKSQQLFQIPMRRLTCRDGCGFFFGSGWLLTDPRGGMLPGS
jgi:hypothetical protein